MKREAHRAALALTLFAATLLCVGSAAQASSPSLEINVTDPAGALVPFARATLEIGSSKHHATVVKGYARFDGLAAGTRTLLVYAAGTGPDQPLPLAPRREVVDADAAALDVRLAKGLAIEGRVVDARGRGKKGALVTAHAPTDWTTVLMASASPKSDSAGKLAQRGLREVMLHEAYAITKSDSEGKFTLIGLGEEHYLLAVAPTRSYAAPPFLHAKGGTSGCEISVRRAKPSRIKVKGPDGKAVANAKVTAWLTPDKKFQDARFQRSMAVFEGVSDKRGRVEIPAFDPRLPMRLTVEAPESRTDLVEFELEPWVPADTTVQLDSGFEAVIHVQDETGKPLRARILRSRNSAGSKGSSSEGRSGPDGVRRVRGLSGGAVWFQAIHDDDSVFSHVSPAVAASRAKPEITLVIPRKPLVLEVRLTGGDGPMSGVLLADVGEQASINPYKQFLFDADGYAKIEGVGAGPYSILALGRGDRAGRLDGFSFTGQAAEVPLTPPPGFSVRVVIPDGVTNVMGVVSLGIDLIVARLAPGDGDLWVAPDLPAGRYEVAVFGRKNGKGYRADAYLVAGADPVTLTLELDDFD